MEKVFKLIGLLMGKKKNNSYNNLLKWVDSHGDVTTNEEQLFYDALPEKLKVQCIRQKRIVDKGRVYYLDFFFFYASLCVEIDGEYHKFNGKHDRKRDQFLLSKGIKTIRFTNEQITDKSSLERIIRYLIQNYT